MPIEKRRLKAARQRSYRLANMPKVLMWNRLRRQAERAAGRMPDRHEIGRLLCQQDARCIYCRSLLQGFHIDHKTPVSRGGSNEIDNLQLLCADCNLRKSSLTHEEFLERLPAASTPATSWTSSTCSP